MNILLIDGQVITRAGLSKILSEIAGIEVVKSTADYQQSIAIIKELKPDVLIIDPFFTADFTSEDLAVLKNKHSDIQFMIVSANKQPANVVKVLKMGIQTYVSKDASYEEVNIAIQHIEKNEKYLCSRTTAMLFGTDQFDGKTAALELSQREKEVIHLIAEGRSDKAIAEELFLSFHTIRTHRKNIAKKLGFSLKNAAELVLLIGYLNDVI